MDIFKAEKTGKLRKSTEVGFLRRKSVPHRLATTRQVAFRKKAENLPEKAKPGSEGKSTLPGVEVAGFEPAAFWSRTKRATKLRYTSMLEPMRGLEPLTC